MQAPLASDVRKFVQSFNMKRMLSSSDGDQMTVLPRSQGVTSESLDTGYQKKRMDWIEYLDPQEGAEEEGTEQNYRGDVFEPKVVTELPKEMFKKPQLKRPTAVQATEDSKLIKSTFSKKKQTLQETNELNKRQRSSTKAASKWSEYLEGDENDLFIEEASLNLLESTFSKKKQTLQVTNESNKRQSSSTKAASKWSKYLEGDEDDLFIEGASLNLLESSREKFQVEDQNVEDEIHPDFA
ncbi:hypothetical protein QJS04_geneDACA020602 [Acorus gramineus]|uniref:Uncharacterized protein n=1 Tax=Acorus gramineus TaxID=55184 RepID=A0AAV9BAV9_ACOGR|nr:hypothetical protein QJS04_geneDACA020602 [Acorus gramineus]